MEFRLDKVPAVIRPRTTMLGASTAPVGKDAKPVKVTEVQMTLSIKADGCMKTMELLFPTADSCAKIVAGQSDSTGMVLQANAKVPDSSIVMHYEGKPVLDMPMAVMKSKPQLRIDSDGNSTLLLRPRVKLTSKQLVEMSELIMADVTVSVLPAQMDISDMTVLASAELGEPKKRGKKSAVVYEANADE